MNKQVRPEDVISDSSELQDEICPKCGALIVATDEGPVCNCNFEEQLAQAVVAGKAKKAEVPQEKPEPPQAPVDTKPQQDEPVFSSREALKKIAGSPVEAQLSAWKEQHGAIYSFPFDMKEIYIWRPLRRREWQMLKSNQALVENEEKFQEQVVMRAVLWPTIDPVRLNLTRAGLVQTLFGVIMQGSYFLHPDFAITLVEEL